MVYLIFNKKMKEPLWLKCGFSYTPFAWRFLNLQKSHTLVQEPFHDNKLNYLHKTCKLIPEKGKL